MTHPLLTASLRDAVERAGRMASEAEDAHEKLREKDTLYAAAMLALVAAHRAAEDVYRQAWMKADGATGSAGPASWFRIEHRDIPILYACAMRGLTVEAALDALAGAYLELFEKTMKLAMLKPPEPFVVRDGEVVHVPMPMPLTEPKDEEKSGG